MAARAGLILVDTKYEFGRTSEGEIILIDEVHTPDSSRFWKADNFTERFDQGLEPENFDKEFIRMAFADLGYRGDGEPPQVPENLWVQASQRYIQIYEMLTGLVFDPATTRQKHASRKIYRRQVSYEKSLYCYSDGLQS